jgi:hypothetical protein
MPQRDNDRASANRCPEVQVRRAAAAYEENFA